MQKNNVFPTMEERLERLKESRAVSPADAAAKVIAISEMEPEEIFRWNSELELLEDMLPERGEESDRLHDWLRRADGHPIRHYQELMPVLEKLLPEAGNGGSRAGVLKSEPDFDLTYGRRFTNVMLLLAFIFEQSVRDKKRQSRLGFCCRMTLGDYTDAVIDLSYTDDGERDEKHVKRARDWKKKLLGEYEESLSLAYVIEEILSKYLEGWQIIGYAEHVVKCRNQFLSELAYQDWMNYSEELEEDAYEDVYEDECEDANEDVDKDVCEDGDEDREPKNERDVIVTEMSADEEWELMEPLEDPENDIDEDWRRYYEDCAWEECYKESDPHGFYLDKAQEYEEECPDLREGRVSVTDLAEMFFLKRDVYRMDTYREILSQDGDSDFRKIVEKNASDAKFLGGLNKINSAVTALKVLLYDPYRGIGADDAIGKYHYEKHLEA